MRKFICKFLIIFVIGISCLFFSLVFFQKNAQEKEFLSFQEKFCPESDMPCLPPHREPPFYIPFLLIVFLSSGSAFFLSQWLIKKERLQEEFVQNLAHDLRNPIIAQQRALKILKEEFNNHELLEGLLQNSQTYLDMINLILEAYSQRKVIIKKTEFDLYNMLNGILIQLKPFANEKRIRLLNNVPKDFIIFADSISINRIITNLMINAVENIGHDKFIKIDAKKEDNKALITIEDNGPGLNINKLDVKYQSLDKTSKKAISGLGLYIVKELVLKNDGNLTIKTQENLFTKFIIEIPLKES